MIFTQNKKMRLDRFLSVNLGISRSQIAQLIAKNFVQINGKTASKSGILLKTNDKIYIEKNLDSLDSRESWGEFGQDLRESALDSPSLARSNSTLSPSIVRSNSTLSPSLAEGARGWVKSRESNDNSQDSHNSLPKITRIYEDDDILVLNKPPFLATHGAPSLKEKSLVEWLKARKIQLSTISGEKREGIIHRLDKQTSGAIAIAKNNRAHRLLSAQLADKSMGRIYLAIIDLPLKSDIEVECYLARNPKNRLKISKVMIKNSVLDSPKIPRGARYSKSKFFKLATSKDGKKELICAQLFTGRTHQIRAHLESINRHIVGDELYGYKGEVRESCAKYRVMLHSYMLYLTHPREFGYGNSSLTQSLRELEKSALDRHLALSRTDFSAQPTNLTQDTRIAENVKDSSLRESAVADSWQSAGFTKETSATPRFVSEAKQPSKGRESKKISESRIEKEINKLDSNLQQNDSNNLNSRDLDCFDFDKSKSRNDEAGTDCHNLPLANLATTRWSALNRHCEGDSPKQSKTNCHIERSEVSKGCESKKISESRIEKEINVVSFQVRDSQNAQILPDRLPRFGVAESRNDEAGTDCHDLQRESRNDGILDSQGKSRNDEMMANLKSKNAKMLFLAPLFDDMQVFLARNFDMGEINEILRKLPAHFGF